jgi:hypothetical protein
MVPKFLPISLRETLKQNLIIPVKPYKDTPFVWLSCWGKSLETVGNGIRYPKVERLETVEDYFQFEHETSKIIDLIKNDAIKVYLENLKLRFPEINEETLHIHYKRQWKVKLRGVHSRVYILALGGKDDSYSPRIGAAIEFLLDDMYYLNQFFDSKSGKESTRNIISAVHSNSLFWPLLVPSIGTPEKKQEVFGAINEDFNNTISGFYYGEYIDCLFNTWTRLKTASLEDRLTYCNKRTYYINDLFFQAIANIAGKVVSLYQEREVDNSRLDSLSDYSSYYGMGLQIVNDIADFVPPQLNKGTSEKMSTDAYSDIKNKKMTYPIILMLEMAKPEDKHKIITCLEKGFDSSEGELRETTDIFLRSGAYHECRALARSYKRKACETAREFPERFHHLLSNSVVILDSNRYYHTLSNLLDRTKKIN